jgi:hypothetical protein
VRKAPACIVRMASSQRPMDVTSPRGLPPKRCYTILQSLNTRIIRVWRTVFVTRSLGRITTT